MLAAMTPQQFDEWLVMYRVRPWGIEFQPDANDKGGADSLTTFRAMAGV